MIPERADVKELAYTDMVCRTYGMNGERIKGFVDGAPAIEQAIYKILMTQRYRYAIYDRNFGIELADLIGMDKHYVCAVLKGRVESALLYDRRIKGIKNWTLTIKKDSILAEFTVETESGDIDISNEFDV